MNIFETLLTQLGLHNKRLCSKVSKVSIQFGRESIQLQKVPYLCFTNSFIESLYVLVIIHIYLKGI